MDIGATVSAVRKEYKKYLRENHPDWAENTLKTHVSDAFYIWNNTLCSSFWKTLADDESMKVGRTAIYDYLKNDILSDKAELRANAYFSDLSMLKKFLDTTYGGVRQRIGYEFDCETTIYRYAKMVYDNEIPIEQAVSCLIKEVPCCDETSHKLMILLFSSMMNGKKYTLRTNTETILYFITQMGNDYTFSRMVNALKATQEHIRYYYEQTGNKSNSICRGCRKIAAENGIDDILFDESVFEGIIPKQSIVDDVLTDKSTNRYWIYSQYDSSSQFCEEGIITIGRDYLGDPTLYMTRAEMQSAMQDCGTERYATTYRNASLEVWQFMHEMKPGDVIFEEKEVIYDSYTADDFLQDVYMSEKRYHMLRNLVLTKKNIILQGAPGVGKTYTAKRLAYSIIGEKDTTRVKMVQFHQSYSYEDFIMGFRPTQTGFELKTGIFYEFCKKAAEDDRPYFFIIDEINRGNLSKIFGELLMLIEHDKRGVELQLLYADEQVSIPGNVYIIGMMNTADRSLAMLDYALRRRFAFFDIKPAFESTGFRAYCKRANNPRFDKLISVVQQLNEAITNDESLGESFCIGHSYFCTNVTINDEWIQSVIEFEIVPLLKEYWFDEPFKVKTWMNILYEVIK